jgi:hypothetical protein
MKISLFVFLFNISLKKDTIHIFSNNNYKTEIYIINIENDTIFNKVTKKNINLFYSLEKGKYEIHSYIHKDDLIIKKINKIEVNE